MAYEAQSEPRGSAVHSMLRNQSCRTLVCVDAQAAQVVEYVSSISLSLSEWSNWTGLQLVSKRSSHLTTKAQVLL